MSGQLLNNRIYFSGSREERIKSIHFLHIHSIKFKVSICFEFYNKRLTANFAEETATRFNRPNLSIVPTL